LVWLHAGKASTCCDRLPVLPRKFLSPEYCADTVFTPAAKDEVPAAALQMVPAGLSINELMAQVNVTIGRIDKALQLMSLESPAPLVKQGTKWMLTAANLTEAFWQRAERLTALRRVEPRRPGAAVHCGARLCPLLPPSVGCRQTNLRFDPNGT